MSFFLNEFNGFSYITLFHMAIVILHWIIFFCMLMYEIISYFWIIIFEIPTLFKRILVVVSLYYIGFRHSDTMAVSLFILIFGSYLFSAYYLDIEFVFILMMCLEVGTPMIARTICTLCRILINYKHNYRYVKNNHKYFYQSLLMDRDIYYEILLKDGLHCVVDKKIYEEPANPVKGIRNIYGYRSCTFILDENGRIWAEGYSEIFYSKNFSSYTRIGYFLPSIVSIDYCENNMLALDDNGKLWVIGYNMKGQLGMGDKIKRKSFILNPNLNNIVQVICGFYYSLFLDNEGSVYCSDTYNTIPYDLGIKCIDISISSYKKRDKPILLLSKSNELFTTNLHSSIPQKVFPLNDLPFNAIKIFYERDIIYCIDFEYNGWYYSNKKFTQLPINNIYKIYICEKTTIIVTLDGLIYKYASNKLEFEDEFKISQIRKQRSKSARK